MFTLQNLGNIKIYCSNSLHIYSDLNDTSEKPASCANCKNANINDSNYPTHGKNCFSFLKENKISHKL